uniref:Phytocyanin domain-containing protein n=4 Tax=Triticinae TaxID=1648030 RepID=A0A453L115_AEGTS
RQQLSTYQGFHQPSMASFSAALVALLVASCAAAAAATTFDVGDGHGWQTGVDYTAWTSDKTFAVGDALVFNYTSKAHTVTEVNKSGYDACSGGNSLSNDDSGATTITLTTPGVHYFICDVPGHCASGMKLAVTVTVAGGSTTGGTIPAGAAGGSLLPAMSGLVTAAAGALIVLAPF